MGAGLAMQRLVVAAVVGIDGLSGVFDGPPTGAVPPYLVIGPELITDWSTKTEFGHEHRVQLRLWDDGRSAARIKPLMGAVEAALAGLSGSADGHRLVSSRLVRMLVLTGDDDWTQGLIEFRLRSVAAPPTNGN
jgi:hypothetical protein